MLHRENVCVCVCATNKYNKFNECSVHFPMAMLLVRISWTTKAEKIMDCCETFVTVAFVKECDKKRCREKEFGQSSTLALV